MQSKKKYLLLAQTEETIAKCSHVMVSKKSNYYDSLTRCPPGAVKEWTQLQAPEAASKYVEKLHSVAATCCSQMKDTEVDEHFFI